MSFLTAANAAITAFREGYYQPTQTGLTDLTGYHSVFARNWAFYTNTAFEDLNVWRSYIRSRGLYRATRMLYNPMRRKVEFYAGRVYPGRLSLDGANLPNGMRLAIPFAEDMDADLKEAVAQIWDWSNWQTANKRMIRFAGVAGSCLVEVVDDLAGGKVMLEPKWAELVKDIRLDAQGGVEMFELEYPVYDPEGNGGQGETYTFGKRVDREEFAYFKNGKPFAYPGLQETQPNPYPFVPAEWVKFRDLSGDVGADCFFGDYPRVEEINSLATNGVDNLHKQNNSAVLLWTKSKITRAMAQSRTRAELDAGEDADAINPQSDTVVYRGAENGKLDYLVGKLVASETMAQVDHLMDSLEADHPELTFWEKLRGMDQVTGPGARSLVGDVEAVYDEVCGQFDHYSQKLFQKAVAVAGWRLSNKVQGWASPNEKQQKFAKFGMDSYAADRLDVMIMPRPLLELTQEDEIDLLGKRLDNATKAENLFPILKRLEVAGIEDEDERKRIAKDLADEDIGTEDDGEGDQGGGDAGPKEETGDPDDVGNDPSNGKKKTAKGKPSTKGDR